MVHARRPRRHHRPPLTRAEAALSRAAAGHEKGDARRQAPPQDRMRALQRPPTPETARAAAVRIAPYVRRTPVFAAGGATYKFEFLQVTGSFKPRGAFNAALQLDDAARARGIVAVSGGNHGLAISHVGKRLGIHATVLMPQTTPPFVVERARAD